MNITLFETPLNNHGCSGSWLELKILNSAEAVVIDGGSCSSCWQTGCDKNEPYFKIGSRVIIPTSFRDAKVWDFNGSHVHEESGERYFNSNELPFTWETAAALVGFSHNELIDDLSNPLPDTTLVKPSNLTLSAS